MTVTKVPTTKITQATKKNLKIFVLFVVFVVQKFLVFASSAAQPPMGPLPRNVVPLSYDLSLTILPDEEIFSGNVLIELEIREPLSHFWMHGEGIAVESSLLTLRNSRSVAVQYRQVTEDGVVRIELPKRLEPQTAVLGITYRAPFNRKLEGLYKVEEDGHAYAFTQFEAISARRCFPGFDEPSFKTPFRVTLTVRAEHQAIANTRAVEEMPLQGGRKRIRFASTQKLPTYLIAFAVGPLDVVRGQDIPPNSVRSHPVPIRGVSVRGKGSNLQYALEQTAGILEILERYFASGYPFDKLDLIAVPDFDWGAMENAGAITFRESVLLLDPRNASTNQKKSFANVMAHELAHQWFGNLVTMPWWDDIWLNEGLASWMDNRVVQQWNPNYKADLAAVQTSLSVMNLDSQLSARPVRRAVKDANDVVSIADGIIFSKGSALARMMEYYLGPGKFQDVIRYHLSKHQFSNAATEDLYKSIAEVAGPDAALALRSFLEQPGVPFLDLQPVCSDSGALVKVKQSRYFPLGSQTTSESEWRVPVCVRFHVNGSVSKKCVLLTEPNGTFTLTPTGCPLWIMPNADGAGYYRWRLPAPGFENLLRHAKRELTVAEQLSLVDSVKAAFSSGQMSAAEALETLLPFASSSERVLAIAPVDLIEFFRNYLVDASQVPLVEELARRIYRPAYARTGFDGIVSETEDAKLLRKDVVNFLALIARDPEVRNEAARRGGQYIGFGTDSRVHPEIVDPNLVETAFIVAVQEGDSKFFEALVGLLKTSTDSLLRERILVSLGKTTDPLLAERARLLTLDPALRTNEVLEVIGSQMAEPELREVTWIWLRSNFDGVVARLSVTDSGFLPRLAAKFCSEERAKEVEEYLLKRVENFPSGPHNLSRTIEDIQLCSAKVKAHRESAIAFLQTQRTTLP